jgi:hypothetical protein
LRDRRTEGARGAFASLVRDERGLSSVELIVLLVLIVSLAVSLWNVLGNEAACRLAAATDAFNSDGARRGQCIEGAPSSGSTSARSSSPRRPTSTASSSPASAPAQSTQVPSTAASTAPGVPPPAPPSSSWFGNPVTPGASGSVNQAAMSQPVLYEQGTEVMIDFGAGALSGLAPGASLLPHPPYAPNGHDVAFGVGEVVASAVGMGLDAAVGGAAAVVVWASPAAGPYAPAVASVGTVAAVVAGAMYEGHSANLQDGLDHIQQGSQSHSTGGGGEPSERAPADNPPEVHMGKQGKHIEGHPNYTPGRSVLKANPQELAKRAGTGTPVNDVPKGQAGYKERVRYDDVIGDFVNNGVATPTKNAIITYAKDGSIHIIPSAP